MNALKTTPPKMNTTLKFLIFLMISLFVPVTSMAQETPNMTKLRQSGEKSGSVEGVARPVVAVTGGGVLPLVVETMRRESAEKGVPTEITQNYWWGGDKDPLWTSTDAQLSQLSSRLIRPADLSQISVVFKNPHLTVSNAAALGKMFGANQVLLGTLQRTIYVERPLGEILQSYNFEGVLLKISGDHPQLEREFSIKRTFLGDKKEQSDKVRKQVLDIVANAFYKGAHVTAPDLYTTKSTSNLAVALRNMSSVVDLQEVIQALEGRKDIKSVNIGWVTDKIITLDLLPETSVGNKLNINEIASFLTNNKFNHFRLDAKAEGHGQVIVASKIAPPVENVSE